VLETRETNNISGSEPWKVVVPGVAEGWGIAMNLETLVLAKGSWFDPFGVGQGPIILGIEDTGLQKSELERWLYMLVNSGGWERVAGVVVGRLNKIKPDDYREWAEKTTVENIITKWAMSLSKPIPVAICERFGHRNQATERERFYPWEWGKLMRLAVKDEGCSLEYV
jgi:muramoyltetrapeptide carboxypeptidase LdcA involved in peptidoglycan recycling